MRSDTNFFDRFGKDAYRIGRRRYYREDRLSSGESSTVASNLLLPMPINRPTVCRARRGRHRVAVKGTHRSNYSGRLMLEREREALQRLRFTGVTARLCSPALESANPDDGYLYLLTEWFGKQVNGQIEWKSLENGGAPVGDDRRNLVKAMVDAVHRLHQAGVYHGDLKPGHFLVSEDWRNVRIIDLGVAQLDRGGEEELNLGGGTPGFSIPDMNAPFPRRDIFSLCATLFYVFAGHPYPLDPRVVVTLKNQNDEKNLAEYQKWVQETAHDSLMYGGNDGSPIGTLKDDPELLQMILDGLQMGWGGSKTVDSLEELELGEYPVVETYQRGRFPIEGKLRTAVGAGIINFLVLITNSAVLTSAWHFFTAVLVATASGLLLWLADRPKGEVWKMFKRPVMYLLIGLANIIALLLMGKLPGNFLYIAIVVHLMGALLFIVGTKRSWDDYLGCQFGFLGAFSPTALGLPTVALAQGLLLHGRIRMIAPIISLLSFHLVGIALGVYGTSISINQTIGVISGLQAILLFLVSLSAGRINNQFLKLTDRGAAWLVLTISLIASVWYIVGLTQSAGIALIAVSFSILAGVFLHLTQDFRQVEL